MQNIVFIREGSKILDNDLLPVEFMNQGKSCFVGIFNNEKLETTIIGYPKYLFDEEMLCKDEDKQLILNHVRLICKFISKTNLKSNIADKIFNQYEHKKASKVNKYQLAKFLLQDYLENGLYGQYKQTTNTYGEGTQDWLRTMENITPIIDGTNVFYDEGIYKKWELEQNGEVSKIHAKTLKEALALNIDDKYSKIVLPDTLVDNSLINAKQILDKTLIVTFVERDISLIKALIAWNGLTVNNENLFIGSCAFDRVWELAIDKVFGNVMEKKSGLPIYKLKNEDGIWKDFIAAGEMIPDTLRIFCKDNIDYFCIFDAKYYSPNLKLNELIIEGAPSSADIAKQIGYYHYFSKMYGNDKTLFFNSFLLPQKTVCEEELIQYVGYAQQNQEKKEEILSYLGEKKDCEEVNLPKVDVFEINPTILFKMCLDEQSIDEKSCLNMIQQTKNE